MSKPTPLKESPEEIWKEASELTPEPHHINPHTGLPCNCHWGRPTLRREASQAVRQLRNQNRKIFRDEQGQQFLDALEKYAKNFPGVEPLIPWLAARYKHGDFSVNVRSWSVSEPITIITAWGDLRRVLPRWIQWMGARQHPLRRGVNIMELSPAEVNQRANQLHEELEEKKSKKNWLDEWGDAELKYTFDPDQAEDEYETELLNKHAGWMVQQLTDADHAEAESAALGHCIGSDSQHYKRAISDGRIEAYSLRDSDGYPRATWHYNEDGTLAHTQGKSGRPKQEWRDLISFFNNVHGKDDDNGGSGLEQPLEENGPAQVELLGPESHDHYVAQWHPDADNYEQAAEEGYNVGEDTEVLRGEPWWDAIYESLYTASPEERHDFYHVVLNNRHHDSFNNTVGAAQRYAGPEDKQIQQEWKQALNRSYNQQGQFVQPHYNWSLPGWETAWDEINRPMFNPYRERGQFTTPFEDALRQQQEQQYEEAQRRYRNSLPQSPLQGVIGEPQPIRRANILDPIHDTLDPRVWDEEGAPRPRLKPHHRKWIMREVHDLAEQFHEHPARWLRLVLTGSLTTYQYSDDSDVDVSLFVNPHFLPEWDRAKLIGLMVENMDGTKLPGTPFEMQCFVVPKNISLADLYQIGLRSGYDIDADDWIIPPERSRARDVEREHNADYVYALESADKMERLLRYEPEKAVRYWHQIHRRRRRDHKRGKGDFSQANIVYKMLSNRGLFPQIEELTGEYIARTAGEVPSIDELALHRWDSECYEVASAIAQQYPHLKEEAGFYVHPKRGAGDHGWNVAPDGTIVDMTATQHGYNGPEDEPENEPEAFSAPQHPEIVPPGHPYYDRYVSWTRHEPQAQNLAHDLGHHEGQQEDYVGVCPKCSAKTAAWHDHFLNQIAPIAQAYEQAPMHDPEAYKAWQELAEDSRRRANELRQRLNISVTDDPEPYPDHHAMFDDINKGKFVVSRANSEHPVWTPDQNVDFRIVHDVLGHHPSGGDFGWQGENLACGQHFGLLTPNAQRALMTECLGQTGYAIHNKGFGPQKVAFMDQFLKPAQDLYNPRMSSEIPEGGFSHRHIRHGVYHAPERHEQNKQLTQRTGAVTEWGQNWDQWQKMAPSYKGEGHHLGWDPKYHKTGKGFILEDGSVWTWPTKDQRPMHMQYSYKAKQQGKRLAPGSAFHIAPDGAIHFIGPGRKHTPEQSELLRRVDPNLKPGDGGKAEELTYEDDLWDEA